MSDHWLTFGYQYLIGGIVFFGIIAMAIFTGALKTSSQEDKNTLVILFGGFVLFFVVHALWTYIVKG